ncbi:uncharacterized protein [Drosophila tropicalis]|uniref:uncharacterized protein n=1 Tax=Drosophila tropicalis TaxID=46794 RepID=UPI0035ABB5F1
MQSPTSWASVVAHGITDKTNDGGLTEVIPPVTNMTNGSGTTKKHTARKNRSGSKKSSTAKNINNSNSSYNNSNNNNNLVVDSQQFVEEPMIKPIEQPKMVPTFQSTPIPIQNANDGILQNYQTIEGPTHLNRPAQTYQPKQRKQSIPKYKRKLFKKRVKSLAVNLDGDPEEILRSGNGQLPESVSQIQFLGPPTDFLMEMEQKEKVLVQTQQLAPQADYQQANAHEDSSIYNDLNLSQLNTSPITNLNTTPDGGLTDVNPYLDAQPQMGNIMPIYYPTPPYIPMQMPIEVPMEMPIEVPMEMPMEVPMKMPMEVPMEMPMEVPMEVPMEMPVPLQHSSPNPQPTQTILEIDDHPFGTTTCSSNGTISSSPKTSGREYLMNNEFFALFPSPDLTEELNLDFLNEEFKELEMEIRAIFDNGAPPKSDNCGAEDNASERCEHIYSISPRQFDDDYSTCSNNDKTYWSDYEQPIEYPPLAISSQLWDPLGPNRRFSDPSNMMPPPPPGFEHLEPSYDCSSLMPYASYFGGKRSLSTRSRNLMGEQVPIVPHIDYPTPVPMNSQQRDLCEHQHFIGAFDTNLKCQLAELTVTNGSTGDGYYVCPELALLPELMDSEDETEVKSNYSYNELLERGKKPKHHSIGSHKFSSFPLEYNEEEKGGYGAEGMGVIPPKSDYNAINI